MLPSLCLSLSFISIKRIEPDGTSSTTKPLQTTVELSPGVSYSQQLGSKDVDETLELRLIHVPRDCAQRPKVAATSYVLLSYVGHASLIPSSSSAWDKFDEALDWTSANATRLGVGDVPKGWDEALLGLCEGTELTITIPPSLGFDSADGRPPRPPTVPVGATLSYEISIVAVLKIDSAGVPFRPCFFSIIDTNGDGYLAEAELERHFARIKQPVQPWRSEDVDGDDRISWAEFSGPKHPREAVGAGGSKDEL